MSSSEEKQQQQEQGILQALCKHPAAALVLIYRFFLFQSVFSSSDLLYHIWSCRHGLRIICSRQCFNQTERQFLVQRALSLHFFFLFSSFLFFFSSVLFCYFLSQPFLLLGFSLTPCILIKILWMFSLFWFMKPECAVSTRRSCLSYVQGENTELSVKLALRIELETKDTRVPQAC